MVPARGDLHEAVRHVELHGRGRDLGARPRDPIRVDVGALASDTYDLVLTVRDILSGAETTSRSSFAILD
jgi:hypothetical protein